MKTGVPQRLTSVNIRKAYENAIPKSNVSMSLPKALRLPGSWMAKQVRCVHDARKTGALWEDIYRDGLETMGYKSGIACACICCHPNRDLTCVVHGCYSTTLGSDENLDWFEKTLR